MVTFMFNVTVTGYCNGKWGMSIFTMTHIQFSPRKVIDVGRRKEKPT